MKIDSNNGFTLLRILAATLVLITHTYVVLGITGGDIFERNQIVGLSKLGVDSFFIMSGFLVTLSLMRSGNLLTFALNRAIRIIPGLAIAVIVTAFIVGPLVSTEPNYLSDARTWSYLYNILIFNLHPFLPGVFEDHAVAVVNGSLWTLPLEVLCYAGLAILAFSGGIKTRIIMLLAIVMLYLHLTDTFTREASFLTVPQLFMNELGYLFLAGSLLASCKDKIPLNWMATAISVGAIVCGYAFGGADWHNAALIYLLLLPYTIISAALLLKRFSFLNKHDISYGVYIYGFVVQQLIVSLFPNLKNPEAFMLLSIVLSYLAGYASWKLVEKPSLSLKKYFAFATTQPAPVQNPI